MARLVHRGAMLEEAIRNCRSYAALEGADRALARLLITTMLRHRGALDEVIGQYLHRPLPARAREAQDLLRLAGAQLLFLQTPAHAAVSTAVALCDDKRELSGYKGLLNAVARKIAQYGPDLLNKQPLRINTPGWMWRSWERGFGPAMTRKIAAAHQQRAPLDLTVKNSADRDMLAREILAACEAGNILAISDMIDRDPGLPRADLPRADLSDADLSGADPSGSDTGGRATRDHEPGNGRDNGPDSGPVSGSGNGADRSAVETADNGQTDRARGRVKDRQAPSSPPIEVTALGPATLRLGGYTGAIDHLPGYVTGRWWVQDLSASIPAFMLGDIAGSKVYDLCAAPGGKTAQLVQMGARVTAIDISQSRLDLLAQNLARLELSAELIAGDVLDWSPGQLADYVLLDAPCSATGTIRRHPDILWSRDAGDVERQAARQSALIDKALTLLKPGGVCVYATCSLQPAEGELQIKAALRRHQGLSLVSPNQGIDALMRDRGLKECFTPGGLFRAFPFHNKAIGGMDGFFAAAMLKPEI